MNAEEWRRVNQVLSEALDLAPVERAQFIADACAGDDSLRREVEALIFSHERAGSFLESGPAQASSVLRVPFPAGSRLGPYEILAAIGAGGMGAVYRAHDTRLGRDVAIKALQQSTPDGAAWERFQREARAASALNHPNICTVYDVGETAGQPYLVMELLDGVTLGARIGGKPLGTGPALALAIQIAGALEAAHAKGIIHRDIKPANVMITAAGNVKILDYGLAKRVTTIENDPLKQDAVGMVETAVMGTPLYLSPEVLEGAPADARSDLWAFGVVLHQMLSGRQPFDGTTLAEVQRRHSQRAATATACKCPQQTARYRGTVPRQATRGPVPECRRTSRRTGGVGHAGVSGAANHSANMVADCGRRSAAAVCGGRSALAVAAGNRILLGKPTGRRGHRTAHRLCRRRTPPGDLAGRKTRSIYL
jgi:hypothetical protein